MPSGLDAKVVEVYTAVGKILSRYSAGKVPKAFKVVPTLKNWEEVLPSASCSDLRRIETMSWSCSPHGTGRCLETLYELS